MRARHRLSKLLLRHGHRLLRRQGLDRRARRVAAPAAVRPARHRRLAFDADLRGRAELADGPPGPARRGDHRDGRRQRVHPGRAPAGLPARGLHADRVRAGRRDRRLAPVHRRHHRRLSSGWCPPSTPPASPGRQGSITKTGNSHARRLLVEAAWHHRPATSRRQDPARPLGPGPAAAARPAATPATGACTPAGSRFNARKKRHAVANVAIARELAGWCWSLAVLDELSRPPDLPRRRPPDGRQREERPAKRPMSSHAASTTRVHARPLDTRPAPAEQPVLR